MHQSLKHKLQQGRKIQYNSEESTFSIAITATCSQETWIFDTEAMNLTQTRLMDTFISILD